MRSRRPDSTSPRPPGFDDDVVALLPSLRAFAMSLCKRASMADDLAMDTVVQALARHELYEQGTNLRAWLFTILRNRFLTDRRKAGREVEDVDGVFSLHLAANNNPDAVIDLKIVGKRLRVMPKHMRDAVLLVGLQGNTYEEAAQSQRVAVGTVKSRVSRGRKFLESGDEAIIEPEIAAVTFTDDANDVAKVRALYRGGLAVSEIAVELPHLERLDVMGILAVNRIRGRAVSP